MLAALVFPVAPLPDDKAAQIEEGGPLFIVERGIGPGVTELVEQGSFDAAGPWALTWISTRSPELRERPLLLLQGSCWLWI